MFALRRQAHHRICNSIRKKIFEGS